MAASMSILPSPVSPIRCQCVALGLTKGRPAAFQMLYVYFDRLVPVTDGQRYTCLEPGRRFLFEATDGGFTSEIEFDDYGLVQNYPGLYQRVD